jgi:YVTN family beta-propeller protein
MRIAIALSAVGALVLTAGSGGAQAVCAGAAKPPQVRARVNLDALAWSIEANGDAVWILTRRPAQVLRVDAQRLLVEGRTRLDVDSWDLALGSGALWVAPNGADGRLRRVDTEARRVRATIGGGASILSNFVAAGVGRVWAGTDERVAHGRGVFEIDPSRNEVIGSLIPTASDIQDIVVGFGSVWVADHSAGRVSRIDPSSRRVVASIRVAGAPHGLAVTRDSVWVALWHESQLQEIDPLTNSVRGGAVRLGFPPLSMAAQGKSLWVAEAAFNHSGPSSSLVRLDVRTRRVGRTLTVPGKILDLVVVDRSLWVGTGSPSRVLRIC